MREYCDIYILECKTGKNVTAQLFEGISDKNISDYDTYWSPYFKAIKHINFTKNGNMYQIEDAHWNWGKKIEKEKQYSLSYKSFAIEYNDMTQGMMQLDFAFHRTIKDNKHLVYVDYLSTAPWNRYTFKDMPMYRRVGTMLLIQAIVESYHEGFNGIIGLHSLPRAENFYKKFGFIDYGSDQNYQNLKYFELDADIAKKYLTLSNNL